METSDLASRITRDWPAGKTIGATDQLTAAGPGPRVLNAGRSCGLLFRIRHGVCIRMVEWQQKAPWEQDMLGLRAHALATHSNACYSHLSAARLPGLRVWSVGREIHVSSPSSLSATSKVRAGTVHRRTVAPEQLMRIRHRYMGMVRLTSLEQTIVDCARTSSFVSAVIIGDSGLHQGAKIEAMPELLGALQGHRGVAAALEGSLKAALNFSARVSTGMYWTSTSKSLWEASTSLMVAFTTADLGSWFTSEKSQTRKVPDFSSCVDAALLDVGGAQLVKAGAASVAAASTRENFTVPPGMMVTWGPGRNRSGHEMT